MKKRCNRSYRKNRQGFEYFQRVSAHMARDEKYRKDKKRLKEVQNATVNGV